MNPLNAEMYRTFLNNFSERRKCSYCGEHNHTIRRCQHPSVHPLRYHILFVVVQQSFQEQWQYLESLSIGTLKMICVLINKSLTASKRESIAIILEELQSMRDIIEILPALRQYNLKKITINTIPMDPKENTAEKECPICYDSKKTQNMFETNCKHTFCIECTQQHLKTSSSLNCPMCRTKLEELVSKQEITSHNKHLLGKLEYRIK